MSKFTLELAVKTAIRAEALSIVFFNRIAERLTSMPDIKMAITELSIRDSEHKYIFEYLLHKAPQIAINAEKDDIDFLSTVDVRKYFDELESPNDMKKPSEIIKFAYEFKKDTVLFYIALRELFGTEPSLDSIIKREKTQMNTLMQILLTDLRLKGIYDIWE